jgi:hypothetical protein
MGSLEVEREAEEEWTQNVSEIDLSISQNVSDVKTLRRILRKVGERRWRSPLR